MAKSGTSLPRRIDITNPTYWESHRSGWKYAVTALYKYLHYKNGIRFISHIESSVSRGDVIREPWVGFHHNVPHLPSTVQYWWPNYLGLADALDSTFWRESMKHCVGIFTLCEYTKKFLKNAVDVPCESVIHPTDIEVKQFDPDTFRKRRTQRVVMIGTWMRRFLSFFKIDCKATKLWLKSDPDANWPLINEWIAERTTEAQRDGVCSCVWLPNEEYDEILTSSVVLLDLYDLAASNTIIECIVRNTPIIVRRLPAAVEYLGDDYPLFFESLEEAAWKIDDIDELENGFRYLKDRDKSVFTDRKFVESFANSSIYAAL